MFELWNLAKENLDVVQSIKPRDVLDILLVSVAIYYTLMLVKGTRGGQVLRGVVVLLVALLLARMLNLHALGWTIERIIFAGAVAFIILFQPELRLALDQIGRGQIVWTGWSTLPRPELTRVVNETVKAVEDLSRKRHGGLIVLERYRPLEEIVDTGRRIGGTVSADFITSIFYPGGPLHDGAVVVRGGQVAAASCILPLSDNPALARSVGTRHRAALGLTEQTDAAAIVVSEETGIVSLAYQGVMESGLQPQALKERMMTLLERQSRPSFLPGILWRHRNGKEHD